MVALRFFLGKNVEKVRNRSTLDQIPVAIYMRGDEAEFCVLFTQLFPWLALFFYVFSLLIYSFL